MATSLKRISSLAAATAVTLFSLSSGAAEPDAGAALSRNVKMWDLDLAKSDDVQTLYERVRAAANDVCRDEAWRHWSSTRRSAPQGWIERCVNDAVDAAVREVGNRRLAALTGTRALL